MLTRDPDLASANWSCPTPTISVVQAHRLAGGCQVAIACDMIVALEDAGFGEPEQQAFERVAKEQGPKAAPAWRDGRYRP